YPIVRKNLAAAEPVQDVGGDPLHAGVRAAGAVVVGSRADVAGRLTQPVRPPDRGRVEHPVVLGARVDRGRVRPVHALAYGLAPGHHPQAGDVGRRPHPLPTDQPRDAVTVPHAGAFEDPVFFVGTGPGDAAAVRVDVPRPDQRRLARPDLLELLVFRELFQGA